MGVSDTFAGRLCQVSTCRPRYEVFQSYELFRPYLLLLRYRLENLGRLRKYIDPSRGDRPSQGLVSQDDPVIGKAKYRGTIRSSRLQADSPRLPQLL